MPNLAERILGRAAPETQNWTITTTISVTVTITLTLTNSLEVVKNVNHQSLLVFGSQIHDKRAKAYGPP